MDSRGRPPPSRCYAQLHPCSATSVLVLVVTLSVQLLPTISIPMAATAINSTTKSSTITNSPLPSPTYTYLSYAQIHHRLVLLSTIFPRLMRLYSAQDRFSLPHVGNCSQIPVTDADLQPFLDDRYASSTTPTPLPTIVPPDSLARPAPCTVWVVELTNFDNLPINPARPQWFVSGELHGDEVIGPIAVLAFIEWMIAHYPYDPFAKRMVDTRVSVLVPMANPVGYFQGVRDEVQQQQQQQQQPRTYDHGDEDNDDTDIAGESGEVHLQFDPNRDFAFDNDPESCMQTVAARALNELYRVNLFRVAVTFHAGTNALSYEWGDTTHCEDQNCHPAPDTRIMAALADRMSANAGSAGPFEDAYPVGDMGSLVYSVRGGMEDWSYAASWASPAVVCATTTLGGYPASKTAVNGATNRAVTFLVEMSQDKRPDEHTLGSSYQVAVRGAQGDGHVPRNVRLLFSVVDAIEPYIIVNETDTYLRQRQVSWTVGGAFLVDATTVQWGIMSNGTQSRATPPSSSPAKMLRTEQQVCQL